ncbi:MAG: hypothetical protein V4584_07020 [Verrucomicrobiota bacterium]
MKTLLILIAAVFLSPTVFAQPVQKVVPVQLGAKAFKDGDVILIEEVRSTSPRLEQGDTVTVKGRYRLASTDLASLQLLLTQVKGDGREETDSKQTVNASQGGSKPFEVTITVKHRGFLHLTFYETKSGKPFGGVYFGTPRQMARAADLSVSHYLK